MPIFLAILRSTDWLTRARMRLVSGALLVAFVFAVGFVVATSDEWTTGSSTFAPYEKPLLAALWLVPLVARSIPQATLIPLAVPLMLAAFTMLLRRAMSETGPVQTGGVLRRAP